MITIATHGITYIEPLDGSGEWYWGCPCYNRDKLEEPSKIKGLH